MMFECSRVILMMRESTKYIKMCDDHPCYKLSRYDNVSNPCFCIQHLYNSSYCKFVATLRLLTIFLYPLLKRQKGSLTCSSVEKWQSGLRLILGRVCTKLRGVSSDALQNNR